LQRKDKEDSMHELTSNESFESPRKEYSSEEEVEIIN